jgi:hypothetical protein
MTYTVEMKILVARKDGIYFMGNNSLVEKPEDAKIFTDLDDALQRVRDVILLATSPVTQIRLLGPEYQ